MFVIGMGLFVLGYTIAYHGVNVLMWAHGPNSSGQKGDPVPFRYLLGFKPPATDTTPPFIPPVNLEGVTAGNGIRAMSGGGPAPSTGPAVNTTPGTAGGSTDPGQVLNT